MPQQAKPKLSPTASDSNEELVQILAQVEYLRESVEVSLTEWRQERQQHHALLQEVTAQILALRNAPSKKDREILDPEPNIVETLNTFSQHAAEDVFAMVSPLVLRLEERIALQETLLSNLEQRQQRAVQSLQKELLEKVGAVRDTASPPPASIESTIDLTTPLESLRETVLAESVSQKELFSQQLSQQMEQFLDVLHARVNGLVSMMERVETRSRIADSVVSTFVAKTQEWDSRLGEMEDALYHVSVRLEEMRRPWFRLGNMGGKPQSAEEIPDEPVSYEASAYRPEPAPVPKPPATVAQPLPVSSLLPPLPPDEEAGDVNVMPIS
jgi:hypothetical protein